MQIQNLLNALKNLLDRDIKVDVQMVQKGNQVLTGISIGKGDIRPVVYIEHYEDLFEAEGYNAVAEKMIETCNNKDVQRISQSFDVNEMTKWDYAKDNICLCIAPVGTNSDYLTIPYLDLELYFRVNVLIRNDEIGSYKVKESNLELWGITKEELLQIALDTNEYIVSSMKDMMIELMTEHDEAENVIEMMNESDPTMLQTVVTTPSKLHGASSIYNKAMLKEIADKYGSNLYIIPSSIHELIIFPTCSGMDINEINNIIKEVNDTQLAPEDRLSDHVYIFRKDTMEITW